MTLFAFAWAVVSLIPVEVRSRSVRAFAVLPPLGFAAMGWGSAAAYGWDPGRWGWAVGAVLWTSLSALNVGFFVRYLRPRRRDWSFRVPPITVAAIVAGTSVLGALEVFAPYSAFGTDADLFLSLFFVTAGLQFLSVVSLINYEPGLGSRAVRSLAITNGLIAFGFSIAFAFFLGQPPPVS